MGNVIGNILPSAIGVAINPVPIIAVILMLFSQQARSNGSAFLLGWVLALAVVGSILYFSREAFARVNDLLYAEIPPSLSLAR